MNGKDERKKVTLYSQIKCPRDRGPGRYRAALAYKVAGGCYELPFSRRYSFASRHDIETKSVVEPLRAIEEPCQVTILSNSTNIVNAINAGCPMLEQEQHSTMQPNPPDEHPTLCSFDLCSLCEKHQVRAELVEGQDMWRKKNQGELALLEDVAWDADFVDELPLAEPDWFSDDVPF